MNTCIIDLPPLGFKSASRSPDRSRFRRRPCRSDEEVWVFALQLLEIDLGVADVVGHRPGGAARPARLDLVDDAGVLGMGVGKPARLRQAEPADADEIEPRRGDLVPDARPCRPRMIMKR